MLLCEGTAVVLDMVRPKAQLVLAACESEWGQHGGGGCPSGPCTASIYTVSKSTCGVLTFLTSETTPALRQTLHVHA